MPTLEAIEKEAILREYRIQNFNKTRTAQALGIAINTLNAKLERYEAEYEASLPKEQHGRRLPLFTGELPKQESHVDLGAKSNRSDDRGLGGDLGNHNRVVQERNVLATSESPSKEVTYAKKRYR